MNLDRWIDNAISLQKIPAPTFGEDERGEFMHNAFRAYGAHSVQIDVAGNVYARCSHAEQPALVISAHLDSVFPPSQAKPAYIRDRCLYGPGIGDNAIALAALLELAADWSNGPGEVWLVANVAEEGLGNLLGMQHVVERFGAGALGFIVLEGMALGYIYNKGLPVRRFRLTAETGGGHAWIHAGRPSAIHILTQLAADLLEIPLPDNPRTSFNIGRISGGTTVNTIADLAQMEVDLRSEDEMVIQDIVEQVEAAFDKHRGDSQTLTMEAIGHRPGGQLPAESPLVQAAIGACKRAGLGVPTLQIGSTDANFPLSLGLPAICVGLTRGGGAHSADEYIELEQLEKGYKALNLLIEQLVGSAAQPG
ncbi:MAG: M20/M25/M40 family metallo-hydrolase [Anaerolineales bacterium]